MTVVLQQQYFVAADWGAGSLSNGTITVTQQFSFPVTLTGSLSSGSTVTVVEQNASHTTLTLTSTGLGSAGGFVLQDASGNDFLFANTALSVGSQQPATFAGLLAYQAPSRVLLWRGGQNNTLLGNAANWNDTTNGLNPALSAPGAPDTAQFLTGGGAVTGTGTVMAAQFGGTAQWNLTAGASLTAGSGVTVGQGGTGSLLVNGGASIRDPGATDVISGTSGGAASVTVDGTGSNWTSAGGLVLGDTGGGGLTVSNQGTVVIGGNSASVTAGLDIARASGGSGNAMVSGAKSLLTNTGRFVVGDAGLGGLSIQSGGTVLTTSGTAGVAGAVIGNTAGASGSSANVSGAGSNWGISGDLVVGNVGFGSLAVTQGATVGAVSLDEGATAGGGGAITVNGAGTALNLLGNLTVGDRAAGGLSITNGAAVNVGFNTIVGATTGASGNIDIEGAGSHLVIAGTTVNGVYNGGDLTVGVNGTGVVTIGNGATLSAFNNITVGRNGRILNFGGVIDPQTLTIQAGGNVQVGAQNFANIQVSNDGTLEANNVPSGVFLSPLITNATAGGKGIIQIDSGANLILNANTVDASQTVVFVNNTGTLTIGQVVTPGTPGVAPTIAPGAANVLPNFNAGIRGYVAGDKIQFNNLTVGSDTVNGNVVTLFSGLAGTGTNLGTLTFVNASGGADVVGATVAAAQIPCYVIGTLIETTTGPRAVESLDVGDEVTTLLGGPGRIIWVGSRIVECVKHPKPETVWPVRIAANAFGEALPARDLYVSPDHAIYVDNVLIPAKHLINGTTIRQVKRARVTYHHIELERHDVVLAEGLPAETYLDTGDRARFSGGAVVTLHPDFAARNWEMKGCAELLLSGHRLEAIRAGLADRAVSLHRRRRSSAR